MIKERKDKGFTLVELAVVLVIIGLLLAAVLRGSQVIRNAKIKNLANDLRQYYAAVYTYLDKYSRLPGDTDYDGKMDDRDPIEELERAGLAVRKSSPFGSRYYAGWPSVPGSSGNVRANAIYVANIPVDVARNLDDKIDDGMADNTPNNDSGRKTGNFRYNGTSGNVTIYFLID